MGTSWPPFKAVHTHLQREGHKPTTCFYRVECSVSAGQCLPAKWPGKFSFANRYSISIRTDLHGLLLYEGLSAFTQHLCLMLKHVLRIVAQPKEQLVQNITESTQHNPCVVLRGKPQTNVATLISLNCLNTGGRASSMQCSSSTTVCQRL